MAKINGVSKAAWVEASTLLTEVDDMLDGVLECLRGGLGATEVNAVLRLRQRGIEQVRAVLHRRMNLDPRFDFLGADAEMQSLFSGPPRDLHAIDDVIANANTRDHLEQAMKTLGPNGFGQSKAPIPPDEIALAKRFLSKLERTVSVNKRCRGSYGLKHDAERAVGSYVSNGALIAAAVGLGFRVQPVPGSFNALLGYTTRSWKAAVGDRAN